MEGGCVEFCAHSPHDAPVFDQDGNVVGTDPIFPVSRPPPQHPPLLFESAFWPQRGQWVSVDHASVAQPSADCVDQRVVHTFFSASSSKGGWKVSIASAFQPTAGVSSLRHTELLTASGKISGTQGRSIADLDVTVGISERMPESSWDVYDGGVGDGELPSTSNVDWEFEGEIDAGDIGDTMNEDFGVVGRDLQLPVFRSDPVLVKGGLGAIDSVSMLQESRADDARSRAQRRGSQRDDPQEFQKHVAQVTAGKPHWWAAWSRTMVGKHTTCSIGVGDSVVTETVGGSAGGEAGLVEGQSNTSKHNAEVTNAEASQKKLPSGGEHFKPGVVVVEDANIHKKLPYMGISMPLGTRLSERIKNRIWQHEFVDVFKLLHRDIQAKEGFKEEEWELARRPRVPRNIENWTAAFFIYASVYCEKHQDRAIAMFKYMDIIRKAYLHFIGFAWLSYDEDFRARVSIFHDKPWGEVDQELWIQWMSSHISLQRPIRQVVCRSRSRRGGMAWQGSQSNFWGLLEFQSGHMHETVL